MTDGQAQYSEWLPPGWVLGEGEKSYTIEKTIGHGGFGITYRARRNADSSPVVIKENFPRELVSRAAGNMCVLAHPGMEDEYQQAHARFVHEAQLLAGLRHQCIVRVCHAFKALGTAYYVMPHVGGISLDKVKMPDGAALFPYVQMVLKSMLGALSYLHGRGVLHRDIKPANILMSDAGLPTLIDFGTAKDIVSSYTHTRIVTHGYTPLEQEEGNGNVGPWSDLYSLGATCYKLITGEKVPGCIDRLTERNSYLSLESLKRNGKCVAFPLAFLQGIDRALELQVENRWPSAEAWLAALQEPCSPAIPCEAGPSAGHVPLKGGREAGDAACNRMAGMESADAAPSRKTRRRKERSHALAVCLALLVVVIMCGIVFIGGAQQGDRAREALGGQKETIQTPSQEEAPPITPETKFQRAVQLLETARNNQAVEEGMHMLQSAAQEGCADAMFELAETFYKGKHGRAKDKIEGARWYHKAAKNGSSAAQEVIRNIRDRYQ